MHESSGKALRIMQLTTAMVVILIIWCTITISIKGFAPVPMPTLPTSRWTTILWLAQSYRPAHFWIIAVLSAWALFARHERLRNAGSGEREIAIRIEELQKTAL